MGKIIKPKKSEEMKMNPSDFSNISNTKMVGDKI